MALFWLGSLVASASALGGGGVGGELLSEASIDACAGAALLRCTSFLSYPACAWPSAVLAVTGAVVERVALEVARLEGEHPREALVRHERSRAVAIGGRRRGAVSGEGARGEGARRA